MKISASIYSDKDRELKEVIQDLVDHQVDLLHVDCNDDLSVFNDIASIRQWCDLPIDLHIITNQPEKYFDYLREHPVEYVTFQYEDLDNKLVIPDDITGKIGLAIITPTPIDVFEEYSNFDFILIMATIPGQSGGVFDKENFNKIRKFRKKFPTKSIHVDGGVNGEVSFILRNMGVTSSVSGSYLFKGPSIGHALMNLTKRNIESHFHVGDFMTPIAECPVIKLEDLQFQSCLNKIEEGNIGFCIVIHESGKFAGLISMADIRKGLIRNSENLNAINTTSLMNTNPIHVFDNHTVVEMLQVVKRANFPVSYLPVLDNQQNAVGIVNFANLIKGEL